MKTKSVYVTMPELQSQSFGFDAVCLPPDRQIPLHRQVTWELSCVVTGAGTRLLSEVSEPFAAGETVLVPPGMPHCWYFRNDVTDADGNIGNISIFFSPRLLERISEDFPEMSETVLQIVSQKDALVFSGEAGRRLLATMQRMVGENSRRRLLSFLDLLVTIAEAETVRKIADTHVRSRDAVKMSQILSYVNCNFARTVTIDEISRHIGMNRTSFCSFFKRHTGMTFTAYLNEKRLGHACELLHDPDRNINEICAAVGLPDTPYFCRLFKKRFAQTPTEYRNGLND